MIICAEDSGASTGLVEPFMARKLCALSHAD